MYSIADRPPLVDTEALHDTARNVEKLFTDPCLF